MDRLQEFLDDLRTNWDNAYWWADHTVLQTALACILVGVIGLGFKWAELRLQNSMIGAPSV